MDGSATPCDAVLPCFAPTPATLQNCLVKNLHRSRLAAATGTLCDAQDRRVRVWGPRV